VESAKHHSRKFRGGPRNFIRVALGRHAPHATWKIGIGPLLARSRHRLRDVCAAAHTWMAPWPWLSKLRVTSNDSRVQRPTKETTLPLKIREASGAATLYIYSIYATPQHFLIHEKSRHPFQIVVSCHESLSLAPRLRARRDKARQSPPVLHTIHPRESRQPERLRWTRSTPARRRHRTARRAAAAGGATTPLRTSARSRPPSRPTSSS
jgi:hypothetical protein